MKKLIYYAGVMILIVILLPMIIVRSCGPDPVQELKDIKEPARDYEITVYNHITEASEKVNLEEYIKCVVAAEMPADFDLEALKAQAVAARTFAYGRMSETYRSKQGVHDGVEICTDSTHCQAWVSREDAMKKWNVLFASRNWSKISKAVDETRGMIVVYQGKVANTLFHASSSGRTENAEDVWAGTSVPYLKSVESSGDEASRGYTATISISGEELIDKLSKVYTDLELDVMDKIGIVDYTTGGRVKTLKIGNVILKGTEFRSILGLRSACFNIEFVEDDLLRITTTGHGHGVGMSQWGANSLAKTGGTYKEILRHYYTGVDIISMSDYEAMIKPD